MAADEHMIRLRWSKTRWLWSRPWLTLTLGVALALLAVLIQPSTRVAPRVLNDNRPLASLVSQNDSSIIVIYDPAVCFRCDMLLPLLEAWADSVGPDRFSLVLTREASEEERNQMALLRIEPVGTIHGEYSLIHGYSYPSELLLVVNGKEVYQHSYEALMQLAISDPVIDYVLGMGAPDSTIPINQSQTPTKGISR